MNLLWIAAIATFVLLGKTVPVGETRGRLVDAAKIPAGVAGLTALIALG